MNSDDPVSLYVITQPNDKDRLRPLVRVIINGITRLLADKMVYREGRAFGDYKHRMLLMLDEFPVSDVCRSLKSLWHTLPATALNVV